MAKIHTVNNEEQHAFPTYFLLLMDFYNSSKTLLSTVWLMEWYRHPFLWSAHTTHFSNTLKVDRHPADRIKYLKNTIQGYFQTWHLAVWQWSTWFFMLHLPFPQHVEFRTNLFKVIPHLKHSPLING